MLIAPFINTPASRTTVCSCVRFSVRWAARVFQNPSAALAGYRGGRLQYQPGALALLQSSFRTVVFDSTPQTVNSANLDTRDFGL